MEVTDRLGVTSGLFNPLLIPGPCTPGAKRPPNVEYLVWNARALFHCKPPLREKKLATLRQWIRPWSLVGILESHGDFELLQPYLRDLRDQFWLHLNSGVNNRIGGILLLVPKAFCPNVDDFAVFDLALGRVSKVVFPCRGANSSSSVYYVHNYETSSVDSNSVEHNIHDDLNSMQAQPTTSTTWRKLLIL